MKTKNWVLLSPDPLHFMDLEISHVQTKFQRPHRVVEVEFSATLIPAPLTLPALQRKYYSSYQTGSNYISGCGTGRLMEKFHRDMPLYWNYRYDDCQTGTGFVSGFEVG